MGAAALVGALAHARGGRVHWRVALAFGAASGLGSLAGTALNRRTSGETILLLFALLLLVAASAMLRRRAPAVHTSEPQSPSAWARVAPAGLAVGALTGFFGVGGGFLIVPALALVVGLPTPAAMGTSLLVIALTASVAFAAHLSTGTVDWVLAGAFTAAAAVGALGGARLADRVSSRRLEQSFAALVAVVAAVLLLENAAALAS